MNKNICAVIFGGTGFIGTFFAHYLLKNGLVSKVYLLDIEPLRLKISDYRKFKTISDKRITYISSDVRNPINFRPIETVNFIANFAAIHREPGHINDEYFETNLFGAQNVCKFAENIKCNQIIFNIIKSKNLYPRTISSGFEIR